MCAQVLFYFENDFEKPCGVDSIFPIVTECDKKSRYYIDSNRVIKQNAMI